MRKYCFAFVGSLALHVGIIFMLLLSIGVTKIERVPFFPQEKPKVVNAVIIEEKSLYQEISRLEHIEQKKVAQEKARQEKLVQAHQIAEKKRQAEEMKISKLKQETARLQKVQQASQATLKKEKAALAKMQQEKAKALAAQQKQQEAILAQKRIVEEQARTQKIVQDQIAQHTSLIQEKIHKNWRQPTGIDFDELTSKIAVKLLLTGEVLEVKVVESSGSIEFDRSAELAVRKSSPLPLPNDPKAREEFRHFTFLFAPEVV